MAKEKSNDSADGSLPATLDIEYWEIDTITPYSRNPRIISQRAIDEVANSILEAGFRQPIVINKDGVIIAGHTRLKASQKLGMSHVPVHIASLPKHIEDRYRLRDNKSGEFSEWDLEVLAVDWEAPELEELGFDMQDLGVQESALELGESKKCPHCGGEL